MGGLLNEEQQKEIIEDLKKYYKRVNICPKCSTPYGSDIVGNDVPFCPKCITKWRGKKDELRL